MSVHSKFKSVACISLLLCYRVGNTSEVGGRGAGPPLFCLAKRKKGNKGKNKEFQNRNYKKTVTHVKMSLF